MPEMLAALAQLERKAAAERQATITQLTTDSVRQAASSNSEKVALFRSLFKGREDVLAQYAGRLHRLHVSKRDVVIYDYVDAHEPRLAKMASRREAGYRNLGYEVANSGELF